ncbi:30S ribosomal protein S2 [Candidatus Gracilibacteria bacterium]|nr:30S ribosomal protein S2 [Candidatus Gracilibacteria bacterium]
MTVSVQQVVDAQVHIGTLKSEAHPKTRKFWADIVNNIVVINPDVIIEQLNYAKEKIQKAKAEGKDILVVCEKKMYQQELSKLAESSGVFYLNYKIPAGFLTNFETLKKRIDSMNDMIRFMESESFLTLTKKEQLTYKRKFDRINRIYKGVTKLSKRPDLVIVIDGTMLDGFVDELPKHKSIDSVVIATTNFSRYYPKENMLMANISSYKSLDFVMRYLLS